MLRIDYRFEELKNQFWAVVLVMAIVAVIELFGVVIKAKPTVMSLDGSAFQMPITEVNTNRPLPFQVHPGPIIGPKR